MSQFDRRKFLVCGLQLPAAMLLVNRASAECVDPDELSASVQSMRDSLDYKDASEQPNEVCKGCSFFMAQAADDGCAHCEVLGGPVNAKGHCVSWTKRS